MLRSNNSITFDPATSKYSVIFKGKTTETVVTDKGSVIDRWVTEIRSMYDVSRPMVVGLDVEWKPTFSQWANNKSAILQLCIDLKCLVVQLFYVDYIPASIKNFLMDPNFTFVGVEVGADAAKLREEYGLDCRKLGDVREAAEARWPGRFSRPGLKDLAKDVAGLDMKKPIDVVRSNWEARYLDENQVEYACIDAYASYKIGYELFIKN